MMTVEEAIKVIQKFSQEYISYKLGGEFACAIETLVDHYSETENGDDSQLPNLREVTEDLYRAVWRKRRSGHYSV